MTALGGNTVLQQIPLEEIQVSWTNPRQHFDEAEMCGLVASIAETGIQVPLLVRPMYDPDDGELMRYELVAGERRFRAATRLELATVPCIVRQMEDAEARETQIVENLQRAEVHPAEEAEAYRKLIDASVKVGNPLLTEDVAKKVGKTTAYVAQRLRLLELEPVAKQLFLESYIALGHALLLARLTAADQERAVRELLRASGDYAKMATAEVFASRKKNLLTNQYARGRRLVEMTEAQLKEWISSNVMLKLKTAPWALDDVQLVPAAGACTACPKRSGSNAALFADLTPDQDVCLDAVCFGVKHKAFIVLTTRRAAEAGEPLLKLTAKSGHKELPAEVTEKLVFKSGQWLKAAKDSCPAVRKGILVDSSSVWSQEKHAAGDIVSVCVNQRCKVHKHTVESTVAGGKGNAPVAESYEVRQKREAAEVAVLRAKETPILRAVYDAMLAKLTPKALYLQSVVLERAVQQASRICVEMGIAYPQPKGSEVGGSRHDDAAAPALKSFLTKATPEELHRASFHALLIEELSPSDWTLRANAKKARERLWEAAKYMGVDVNAIAKASAPKPLAGPKVAAKREPAKKAAAKKAVVKKVAPAKKVVKKLDAAGKKRIADAMKKCWAERRKKAAK